MYIVYQTKNQARTIGVYLEWTSNLPTRPGWYQVVEKKSGNRLFAEILFHRDGYTYVIVGGGKYVPELFTHYLGPIPLAERPTQ